MLGQGIELPPMPLHLIQSSESAKKKVDTQLVTTFHCSKCWLHSTQLSSNTVGDPLGTQVGITHPSNFFRIRERVIVPNNCFPILKKLLSQYPVDSHLTKRGNVRTH